MHYTDLPSGGGANHNGDFSGDVWLTGKMVEGGAMVEVMIPFEDMLALVGTHLLGEAVSKLENMDPIEFIKGMTMGATP